MERWKDRQTDRELAMGEERKWRFLASYLREIEKVKRGDFNLINPDGHEFIDFLLFFPDGFGQFLIKLLLLNNYMGINSGSVNNLANQLNL